MQASVYDEQQKRSHSVRIDAKVVVTACGSIHSPALLLRSGLRNPNIGKHLRYALPLNEIIMATDAKQLLQHIIRFHPKQNSYSIKNQRYEQCRRTVVSIA